MAALVSLFLSTERGARAEAVAFGFATCPKTNAVLVLPPVGERADSAWATGTTYRIGDFVVTNGVTFYCVSHGLSGTNAGAFKAASGTVSDGTVTWRKALGRVRRGFVLTFNGTGDIYWSFETKASDGVGVFLKSTGLPSEVWYTDLGIPQVALWAYSTNDFSVFGQEW